MPSIRALVRLFPQHLVQKDLPRLQSFLVATVGDNVVGCCALQVYSKRLAEVRTLAVHPDFHDRGIASKLVEGCKHRAAARRIKELFAVTSQIPFFEKARFRYVPARKDRNVFRPLKSKALIPYQSARLTTLRLLENSRTTEARANKFLHGTEARSRPCSLCR